MRRGEVWWAELEPPAGRRPVVILTRDAVIQTRSHVTVAPLTRTVRDLAVEIPLSAWDGLPKACVINVDSILTVEKARLLDRICMLRSDKMSAVSRALKYALSLE